MKISTKELGHARFGTVLSKLLILVLAVFTIYLLYLNFSFSVANKVLLYSLIVVPVFFIVYILSYKINISPKVFSIVVFLLAFLAKGLLAYFIDAKPVSDFETFYKCAINLLHGNKEFGHGYYFEMWAYQTGPVIYYAGIMKVVGTSLFPIKLVNCFFMAGTNLFIYLIARIFSNEQSARFISILYLLYPEPYFLAPVLTNQHFAACMFLLSLYLILNDSINFYVRTILSGVFMAIGNAVRPLGVILVVSVLIWGIIEVISHKKVAKVALVAVVLVSYLLTSFSISTIVMKSDIDPQGLANNFPLWKFVIGLNQQSKGEFSYEDEKAVFTSSDLTQRNNTAKKLIAERLSVGPIKLLKLMNDKQKIMWAQFDTLRWGFYHNVDNNLVPGERLKKYEFSILCIEKIYYILAFILLLIGLYRVFMDKKVNSPVVLLSIILMCYFGALALIEIQVRYRYFAVILVFVLAAKGSELLFEKLKKVRIGTRPQ